MLKLIGALFGAFLVLKVSGRMSGCATSLFCSGVQLSDPHVIFELKSIVRCISKLLSASLTKAGETEETACCAKTGLKQKRAYEVPLVDPPEPWSLLAPPFGALLEELACSVFSSTVRPVKAALWTQSMKQRCLGSNCEQP